MSSMHSLDLCRNYCSVVTTRSLVGHSGSVDHIAFNGKTIISGGSDRYNMHRYRQSVAFLLCVAFLECGTWTPGGHSIRSVATLMK